MARPSTSSTHGSGNSSSEAEAASSVAESSTGDGLPVAELCRSAMTEDECVSLDELCMWQPTYEVLDLETCAVSTPDDGCWAKPDGGVAGCVGYFPLACHEMEVQPFYREVDGVLYLLDLDSACNDTPQAPSGEPQWQFCPADEFEPAPPACYCLCGGPPG